MPVALKDGTRVRGNDLKVGGEGQGGMMIGLQAPRRLLASVCRVRTLKKLKRKANNFIVNFKNNLYILCVLFVDL